MGMPLMEVEGYMLGLSEATKAEDDKRIKPGVYTITNEAYHAGQGISNTHLTNLVRSPAHYQQWLTELQSDTDDMKLGRLTHAVLLEPETVQSRFLIAPNDDGRTKEYKDFAKDNAGFEIIKPKMLVQAKTIAEALKGKVLSNPSLNNLFVGLNEQAFYWNDPDTGILCKCKPDVLTNVGIITDLKVTEDASEKTYQAQIARQMYFMQSAFYIDGVNHAIQQAGLDLVHPDSSVLVAIERDAPYEIGIYALDPRAIAFGRAQYKRLLKTYAECLKTGQWPGYERAIKVLDLPNWVYYAHDGGINE